MSRKKRAGRDFTLATRRKHCNITLAKVQKINFKDVELLEYFITEKGKIIPGWLSGISTNNQRKIMRQVKLARNIALLSFAEGLVRTDAEVTFASHDNTDANSASTTAAKAEKVVAEVTSSASDSVDKEATAKLSKSEPSN